MKNSLGLISIFVVAFCMLSFIQNPKQWVVPEKYQKMKNPVKSDSSSVMIGKEMYIRHCVNCHGVAGKGDGKRAIKLNQTPGDFTTDAFKKESDGAVFYKMTEGHKDMPAFKRRIPSNDDVIEGSFGKTGSVGDLINYIRTLGKK